MRNHISRRLRTALALLVVLAVAAPAASAAAAQRAILRATGVRVESACAVYIGTDGAGSSRTVQYSILPAGAAANKDASLRLWSSDDARVATVTQGGAVKAVGPGTTYVRLHLEDGSGLEAKCKVTVGKQPVASIKLNRTSAQQLPGTTCQLRAATAPANAYGATVRWASSNAKIATVNRDGLVKLYRPGKVKIKATCGKLSATCTFLVGYDFDVSHFRAYSICNYDYPASVGALPAFEPSAVQVHGAYRTMVDAGTCKLTKGFRNQTGAQMRAILTELATNPHITEDDVTVLYFSGRGGAGGDPAARGALLGIDADKPAGAVTIAEVQAKLDRIPGVVVLILDSHMAGQWIKGKAAQDGQAAASFNRMVIDQFKASTATNFNPKAIEGATKTKYKIFASCSALGRPYTVWDDGEEDGFSFFSRALALAYDGKADYNHDTIISLREAAYYASRKVDGYIKAYNKKYKKSASQKVSVWPTNDYAPIYAMPGDLDGDEDLGDDDDTELD